MYLMCIILLMSHENKINPKVLAIADALNRLASLSQNHDPVETETLGRQLTALVNSMTVPVEGMSDVINDIKVRTPTGAKGLK